MKTIAILLGLACLVPTSAAQAKPMLPTSCQSNAAPTPMRDYKVRPGRLCAYVPTGWTVTFKRIDWRSWGTDANGIAKRARVLFSWRDLGSGRSARVRIRAWRPRYCDDGTYLYSRWRFVGRFGAKHRRFSGTEQTYCPDMGIPTHITNPAAVMLSATDQDPERRPATMSSAASLTTNTAAGS